MNIRYLFAGLLWVLLPVVVFAQNDVPSWAATCGDKGLWLGISPQITNKEEARCFAITNAMLSYMFTTGNANVSSSFKDSYVECSVAGSTSGNEDFGEQCIVELKNIAVDVVREYHSGNGEYFVACKIVDDNKSTTSLQCIRNVTASIKSENFKRPGNYEFSSSYLLTMGEKKFQISFASNACEDELKFNLRGEDVIVYNTNVTAQIYKPAVLGRASGSDRKSYKAQQRNSLGYTQFREFNFWPLFSSEFSGQSHSAYMSMGEKEETSEKSLYKSAGRLLPVNLCLNSVNGTEVVYSAPNVKKPGKNALVFEGGAQNLSAPLWFAKSYAFYHLLNEISAGITAYVTATQNEQTGASGSSQITDVVKIRIHSIDWCPDVPDKTKVSPGGRVMNVPFVKVYCNPAK